MAKKKELSKLEQVMQAAQQASAAKAAVLDLPAGVTRAEFMQRAIAAGDDAVKEFYAKYPMDAAGAMGELALKAQQAGKSPEHLINWNNKYAPFEEAKLRPVDFGIRNTSESYKAPHSFEARLNTNPLDQQLAGISSPRQHVLTRMAAEPDIKAAQEMASRINITGQGATASHPYLEVGLTEEADRAAMLTQGGRIMNAQRAVRQAQLESVLGPLQEADNDLMRLKRSAEIRTQVNDSWLAQRAKTMSDDGEALYSRVIPGGVPGYQDNAAAVSRALDTAGTSEAARIRLDVDQKWKNQRAGLIELDKLAMAGPDAAELRATQDLAHVAKLRAAKVPEHLWPENLVALKSVGSKASLGAVESAAGRIGPVAEGAMSAAGFMGAEKALTAIKKALGFGGGAPKAPAAVADATAAGTAARAAEGVAGTVGKAASLWSKIPGPVKAIGGAVGAALLVKQLIDTVMSTSREDQQRLLEDHMATRNNTGADNDQVNLQRLLARRSEMDDQLEMTAGMRLNRAMTALSDREKQLIGQDAVSVGPSAAELYGKMGY